MQAIVTKYFGPSNIRGSRIKASCQARSITISYDYALNSEGNHRSAAIALQTKMGWDSAFHGPMIGGAMPDGNYACVFVNGSPSTELGKDGM